MWRYNQTPSNEFYHSGVKGMRWGVRKAELRKLTPANSPKELSDFMQKNIGYSEFSRLKSPENTIRDKAGACHDQVLLELHELKRMGIDAKAEFFVEYDPKTKAGGATHSFVYYNKGNKTYWLENAWDAQKGLHEYESLESIKNYILQDHASEPNQRYPKMVFSDFGRHSPGENLQQLMNKALKGVNI